MTILFALSEVFSQARKILGLSKLNSEDLLLLMIGDRQSVPSLFGNPYQRCRYGSGPIVFLYITHSKLKRVSGYIKSSAISNLCLNMLSISSHRFLQRIYGTID